ncbi:alpha/beta hydrolase [Paenibacillus sp. GCM10023252]|uniref:alpha/beta hydrolase n=1 Tax=Paenibacillus sp. GCM10023252 TaxID=3252649 RepID=UPI003623F634
MKKLLNQPYSSYDMAARLVDLYIPDSNPSRTALFFIHGGGWSKGSKEQFREVAEWFCERGYFCTSMSYHFSQDRLYPGALEDARLAYSYVQGLAEQYGFDPARMVVLGSSAGGYLAAMLAMLKSDDSKGYTDELQDGYILPLAAALYCPVTTLRTGSSFVTAFMGGSAEELPERYRGASPIEAVQGGEPPFLIINGGEDSITPLSQIEAFSNKLKEAGGHAELKVLPGVGHGFCYGIATPAQQQSCEMVLQFIAQLNEV